MTQSRHTLSVRGIHLDLKGVPPTIDRLLQLLTLAAAAGYNAALFEWEDMFPWSVNSRFRAPYSYTVKDLARIYAHCAAAGIDVIPLVQCLGHMETPLSVPENAPLRELPYLANVLNPLAPGARQLVEHMVDDVLAGMPTPPKWFHLGGDEAWSFGKSPAEQQFIANHGGPGALYLHHVEPILDRLISRGIRPILWHDMMSHWEVAALPRIAAKADLMVWGYGQHPDATHHHYRTEIIERFHKNNVSLWGACTYKGGDGGSADIPTFNTRRDNAIAWTDVSRRFNMTGVIATAWSRYTTHRLQCEPIDGALDVLVAVGQILTNGITTPAPTLREEALTLLDRLGEGPRYDQCHAALKELQQCREGTWQTLRELREQIPLGQKDPKRNQSGMAAEFLYHSIRWAVGAHRAAIKVRQALTGLIPNASLEEYLMERLTPLQQQCAELVPVVSRLEPDPWSASRAELVDQKITSTEAPYLF